MPSVTLYFADDIYAEIVNEARYNNMTVPDFIRSVIFREVTAKQTKENNSQFKR